MELTKELEEAIVAPGPQGFHPPSAAELGVLTPEVGFGLKFGHVVAEELAMEAMARAMLTRKNATIFPGPMVLWNWNDHAAEKAKAVLELAAQLPDVLVIPMPDYRPKYPKVEPEEVINPNHPNLTR